MNSFRKGLVIGCFYDLVLFVGLFVIKNLFVVSVSELRLFLVLSGFMLVMLLVCVTIFDRLLRK